MTDINERKPRESEIRKFAERGHSTPAELHSDWDAVRTRRREMKAEYGLIPNVEGRDNGGHSPRLPTIEDMAELERLMDEENRLWRAYEEELSSWV